jgi:hypothetical protein
MIGLSDVIAEEILIREKIDEVINESIDSARD